MILYLIIFTLLFFITGISILYALKILKLYFKMFDKSIKLITDRILSIDKRIDSTDSLVNSLLKVCEVQGDAIHTINITVKEVVETSNKVVDYLSDELNDDENNDFIFPPNSPSSN